MGILQISQKKPYKIGLIVCVALGVIFLAVGGIISLATNDVAPFEINITGMTRNSGGNFEMIMRGRTAPIQVSTEPGNLTNQPVIFTIQGGGAAFIEIAPMSMRSGDTAILTLRNDANGVPNFNQTINILVEVAGLTETIVVRTELARDDAVISTEMMPVTIYADQQPVRYLSLSAATAYRVDIAFTIMGQTIRTTQGGVTSNNPGMPGGPAFQQRNGFTIIEISDNITDILLFGDTGNIFVPGGNPEGTEARFEITTTYQGMTFREEFVIRIVA